MSVTVHRRLRACSHEGYRSAVLMSQGLSTVAAMVAVRCPLFTSESVTPGCRSEHADQISGQELLRLPDGDACP